MGVLGCLGRGHNSPLSLLATLGGVRRDEDEEEEDAATGLEEDDDDEGFFFFLTYLDRNLSGSSTVPSELFS